MVRETLGELVKEEIERQLAESKPEVVVDLSLDWGNSPTEPNTTPATKEEIAEAMTRLRFELDYAIRHGKYGIPYIYITCRREVAYALRKSLFDIGYKDELMFCRLNGQCDDSGFRAKLNYYEYYFGVAKHPKAFNAMVAEINARIK